MIVGQSENNRAVAPENHWPTTIAALVSSLGDDAKVARFVRVKIGEE